MLGICLMNRSGMGSSWLPYQRNVIFKAVSSLRFPPCCRLKGGTELHFVMAVYMHNCGCREACTARPARHVLNISSVLSPRPAAYRSTPKRAALDRMGRSCPARDLAAPLHSLQGLSQQHDLADRYGVSVIHPQQVAAPAATTRGRTPVRQCLLRLPCIAPEGTAVTDGQLL